MRFLTLACIFSTFLLSGLLSGCGVKPSNIEKPVGKEDRVYPRTYPDPDLD